MSRVRIHKLDANFRLEIGTPWQASPAIDGQVTEFWRVEQESRGYRLSDGRIFHLSEYTQDYLRIQPAEYRYSLARQRVPHLVDLGLDIRPLAVTGILLCGDGIVLGRRGEGVATDAGLWEPSPAGGLSQPDPKMQVLEELEEELGLSASQLEAPEACGLVEDQVSGVFDIIFRLRTSTSFQEVQRAQSKLRTNEYSELTAVRPPEIEAFLEANANQVLPALRPMLQLAGFL